MLNLLWRRVGINSVEKTRIIMPVNSISYRQTRFMSIHEYKSMQLLQESGILVPAGKVAETAGEAQAIANDLLDKSCHKVFVKAQVLTGGRGKGVFKNGWQGGVKGATDAKQALEIAHNMLGQTIVTKQSGPAGKLCSKVNTL